MRRAISLEAIQHNEPTKELADTVVEESNALLESLEDEKLRTVAGMKLEGYTNTEIAERIGRSVKTVEWRLKQVRKRLVAALESGGVD